MLKLDDAMGVVMQINKEKGVITVDTSTQYISIPFNKIEDNYAPKLDDCVQIARLDWLRIALQRVDCLIEKNLFMISSYQKL